MEDLQDLIVMTAGVTAHEGTKARSSFYLLAVPDPADDLHLANPAARQT
jgi:hypothetical protein